MNLQSDLGLCCLCVYSLSKEFFPLRLAPIFGWLWLLGTSREAILSFSKHYHHLQNSSKIFQIYPLRWERNKLFFVQITCWMKKHPIKIWHFTFLWANSADDKLKVFSFFPRKTGFDISCTLSPMKTMWMKCQILFSGKIKKKMSTENFYPEC